MFLDLFEKKYKGIIINDFLSIIRNGYSYPDDIIDQEKLKINYRKKFGEIDNHWKILEKNLDNEEIYPFIEEYIKYDNLTREQQIKVKQIKINAKKMQKKLIKDIFNNNRPLSWSAIYSWQYSKEDWAKKYIENEQPKSSKEMEFGKKIGKLLETDPTYLPQIPRHSKMEQEFRVISGGIPLIGYADSFCDKTHKKLLEFKTGKKEWDQKRTDEHGQITMYCLMNYITHKVKPEDMEIALVWMPTQDNGDFSISFVEPIEDNIKIFKTKRTMQDILKFAGEIKKVYAEMADYVANYKPK